MKSSLKSLRITLALPLCVLFLDLHVPSVEAQVNGADYVLSAGNHHTVVKSQDGSLWAWGSNDDGQLGADVETPQTQPRAIGTNATWRSVSAGGRHTVAIREDGSIWSWGANEQGQLGRNGFEGDGQIVRIGSDLWLETAAGGGHTLAIRSDGTLWSWGSNSHGQLGVGFSSNRSVPVLVDDQHIWVAVAAGDSHSLAIRADGSLWAWGKNAWGQLGIDSGDFSRNSPVRVGSATWTDVSAGGEHTLGVRANGTLWSWGWNQYGQLGSGSGDRRKPGQIGSASNWQTVAAGALHSLGLTTDGALYAWGRNFYGQLGDGTNTDRSSPVQIGAGSTWVAIAAGLDHSVAVKNDGVIWAAGHNFFGQLGDGTTEQSFGLTASRFGHVNLVVDSISIAGTPAAGESVTITVTGRNLGSGMSPPFAYDIAMATEPDWESGIQPLHDGVFPEALGHGDTFAITQDIVIPSHISGHYYFGVNVNPDRDILESDFSDNIRWTVSSFSISITEPDLAVSDIQFAAGEYILGNDRLTVNVIGRNQGGDMDGLPDDLRLEVVLSRTADWNDAVHVGYLNRLSNLDSENRFVYNATLDLPEELAEGDYFVGVIIETAMVEVTKENNRDWSDQPGVRIVRLPDLVVTDASHEAGFYHIHSPDPQNPDEMQLAFTLQNEGYADVLPGGIPIQILLSTDRIVGNADDSVLLEVSDPDGLAVGQSRTYHVTLSMPAGVRVGAASYLAVWANHDGSIDELNHGNNWTWGSDERDVFVSEVPLDRAVDAIGAELDIPDRPWWGHRDQATMPWFGQTAVSHDGRDAAQSGRITHNGRSTFTIRPPETASMVSFYWKVDSEFRTEPTFRHDYLSFSINGVEQARISGDIDWHRMDFTFPPGDNILEWSYTKDHEGTMGADAGWVDQIVYDVPNLIVESLDYLAGSYSPGAGQQFDATVTIRNTGATSVSAPFDVQLRLSRNLDWGTEDDVELGTVRVTEGLAAAGEPGSTKTIVFQQEIPANITYPGFYYTAVMVDSRDEIVESSEDDNVLFSVERDVHLTPTIALHDGLDDDRSGIDFGNWIVGDWTSDGSALWFGILDPTAWDGEDAVRSGDIGVNQRSGIEREIEIVPNMPAEVVFRWKVSSLANANYFRFLISGVEQRRISGETGWIEERIFVPAGPQILRWEYVKTNGQVVGDDAGFLDSVEIFPIDMPDLIVNSVDYEPGEYVLQRDFLPVQVVVENRGVDMGPPEDPLNPLLLLDGNDVEVRLSQDRIWGNEDDVVLGHFANVSLDSTNRLVFSGELPLPLFTAAGEPYSGNYYLAILVRPNAEIDEYDYDNNFFWSGGRDVTIRRLPNLTGENFTYDQSKLYYPKAIIEFDYIMRNVGLGNVSGGVPFAQRIELRARDIRDPLTENWSWITDSIEVAVLAEFSENVFMPGVSHSRPNGSSLDYQTRLVLPDELHLMLALDIIDDENATQSTVSDDHRQELRDFFEFSLLYTVDVFNSIEESDEANVHFHNGIGRFYMEPVLQGSPTTTIQNWAGNYGMGWPHSWPMSDEDVLWHYALDLNPLNPVFSPGMNRSAAGGHNIGFIEEGDQEYLRITFPIVRNATDLIYVVEVASSVNGPWEGIGQPIVPPFTTDQSLTGVGGLLERENVVAVADHYYTAIVTVRDNVGISNAPQRFIRLRVIQQ